MFGRSRREFLVDVGRGMLVASLRSATAMELGVAPTLAEESGRRLTFGRIEPLVSFMQEASLDKLLPALVDKLNAGMDLKTLVSAAALANARAFGGQDYAGYHAFMALVPAYQMAGEPRSPIPTPTSLAASANRTPTYCSPKPKKRSRPTTNPARAPWYIVTENSGCPRGRCSICW